MTPEALSHYPQIQELRVTEVANYLHQNRWMSVSYPNSRILVFEKGIDDQGKPIQIVLPSQDEYEDRPYLLAKAVNLLSVLDSIPFQEIVNAIRAGIYAG